MNALRQLEWALLELQQSTPLASVSGAISEIAPTHFRVSGLSRFVRLGELIGVNSGVTPDRPATAIADFSRDGFKQGYVEGSGANPMMELTKLMAASRAFDGTNSMIEGTESSLQNAIRTLGEPGK